MVRLFQTEIHLPPDWSVWVEPLAPSIDFFSKEKFHLSNRMVGNRFVSGGLMVRFSKRVEDMKKKTPSKPAADKGTSGKTDVKATSASKKGGKK
jgi:hypothetical protein